MIINIKCSSYSEFFRFMKEHDTVQRAQLAQAFTEDCDGSCWSSDQEWYSRMADLAFNQIIERDWESIVNDSKAFYENNGYVDLEYDDLSGKVAVRKRDKGRPKSIMPRKNVINLRLTDDEIEKLDNYCNTNKTDKSAVLRDALTTYLDDAR